MTTFKLFQSLTVDGTNEFKHELVRVKGTGRMCREDSMVVYVACTR